MQQQQQQQTASPPSIVKQKSVTASQSPGVATATVSKALVAQKSFSDSSTTTSATAKSPANAEEPIYSTVIKVAKKPGTPGSAGGESSRPNNSPTKPVAKGLVAAATKQFERYPSAIWGRNALSGFYDNNFYSGVAPEDEEKDRQTDEERSNSSGGESDFDDFDDDEDDDVGARALVRCCV